MTILGSRLGTYSTCMNINLEMTNIVKIAIYIYIEESISLTFIFLDSTETKCSNSRRVPECSVSDASFSNPEGGLWFALYEKATSVITSNDNFQSKQVDED